MLSVKDLTARYGNVAALHSISVEVHDREIVGVVGKNGAGKTTLLRSIVGVVRDTEGLIEFDGQSLGGLSPETVARRGIALVPENGRVFHRLTVEENLRVSLAGRGTAVGEAVERTVARFPALGSLLKQPAGRLSGGEQQQLAIARALLTDPKVLLMDEPSLGLAPLIVDRVFEILEHLRDEGVTILLVEQFVDRATELADRTYVLRRGAVAAHFAHDEIASDELEAAYFGFETRTA